MVRLTDILDKVTAYHPGADADLINKAYIYAAMGFSVFVEALNLRARRRRQAPVELRPTFVKDEAEPDATG